jgi:hypothetical protein
LLIAIIVRVCSDSINSQKQKAARKERKKTRRQHFAFSLLILIY